MNNTSNRLDLHCGALLLVFWLQILLFSSSSLFYFEGSLLVFLASLFLLPV